MRMTIEKLCRKIIKMDEDDKLGWVEEEKLTEDELEALVKFNKVFEAQSDEPFTELEIASAYLRGYEHGRRKRK